MWKSLETRGLSPLPILTSLARAVAIKVAKFTLCRINIIFVTLYFITNQVNQLTQEIKQLPVIVTIRRIA